MYINQRTSAVFDSYEKNWVFVMISVYPGQIIVRRCRNFSAAIFSDCINVINVKRCLIVLLIELYLFIPLSVIFTIIASQGYSSLKQF